MLLSAPSRIYKENSYNRISRNRFMCLTHPRLARMNYNELKIRILGLFEPTQDFDSLKIRELLATDRTLR